MDDALRERIRELAETHGLDPAMLEKALGADTLPEELEQVMARVMGDVSLFHQALKGLDKK